MPLTAGIVDTGCMLTLLSFPVFRKYMQLKNATIEFDLPDRLLYVESENALQSLFFHIGNVSLHASSTI
jgi:hypothetical protein